VYVNSLPLRDPAIVQDGVTYLPLRAIAESLNCTVTYDPKVGHHGLEQSEPAPQRQPANPTPSGPPRAPTTLPGGPSPPSLSHWERGAFLV